MGLASVLLEESRMVTRCWLERLSKSWRYLLRSEMLVEEQNYNALNVVTKQLSKSVSGKTELLCKGKQLV